MRQVFKFQEFQSRWLQRVVSILKQLFLIATVGSLFVFIPLRGRLGSQSFEPILASTPEEDVVTSPTKGIQVFASGRSSGSLGPGGNQLIRK